MRFCLTILCLLIVSSINTQKTGARQLWWNIMPVIYVAGNPPPPPILGPQGYGVNATGSLPGDPVITVTTNSGGTGVGSLYWAIFTANGATGNTFSRKKIVFNIPGPDPHTINVANANRLEITQFQNVTIDGGSQDIEITSPSNNGLSFQGANNHNVILQNLYFVNCGASDNNSESDGLNMVDGAHDFCVTNCCAYGNTDGNIDIGVQTHNITLQYTIVGNHTSNSTKGAGGTLINGTDITIHHNLYNLKSVVEGERGPFLHGNYSDAYADIRYNLDYNFGRAQATGSGFGTGVGYNKTTSDCGCRGEANVVNNYYYTPSATAAPDAIDVAIDNRQGAVYSTGNISGNGINLDGASYHTTTTPFPVPTPYNLAVEPTCQAVHEVLSYVGPTIKNATATTLINQVTNIGTCSNGSPILPMMDRFKIPELSLQIYKWMQPTESNSDIQSLILKSYHDQYFIREEKLKFNI